ncbi:hypothetical protein QEN19_001255 [Hanseniaspora menglaensis]
MPYIKKNHFNDSYANLFQIVLKRAQATSQIAGISSIQNNFKAFSSKGPFSSVPEFAKKHENDSSMILKLPPLTTYHIRSLNFSGVIQEASVKIVKNKEVPWYKKFLFFNKKSLQEINENDNINLELLSDNTNFQKISTLNKPTNILINLFTNTTKTITLNINYNNSYTLINPNLNLLSYSENITRVSSGSNIETIGGFGIVTLFSENNFQQIIKQKDQEVIFEADRLIGFVNNSKLSFQWTTLNSESKTLYGNAKKYLKCFGEGEIILKN